MQSSRKIYPQYFELGDEGVILEYDRREFFLRNLVSLTNIIKIKICMVTSYHEVKISNRASV